MKKAAFLAILLLFLSLTDAHAGQNRALEALEVLRRGFADMTDFTAEIVQEKQIALMKQKMVSKGVVRFKKPGMFAMELYPPYASRLLLRDNVMTLRFPAEGVTERIVLPPEESLERWFAYLDKPVTALPDGVDARAERQGGTWTLQIFPRNKGGVKEVQLTFEGDGRLKRLAVLERNRDRTVIRFATMRRNVGLKESDFNGE
ncbi:MAG: outer membrane lipoprotein carrier [Geobacteraceae bacterium]|nr:MAG: outer membrane lipoprotein carrier [Geobacteraceae bacterium]